MKIKQVLLILPLSIALACGGGGGDDDNNNSGTTITTTYRGQVLQESSARALVGASNARVTIVSSGASTITDSDGQYVLVGASNSEEEKVKVELENGASGQVTIKGLGGDGSEVVLNISADPSDSFEFNILDVIGSDGGRVEVGSLVVTSENISAGNVNIDSGGISVGGDDVTVDGDGSINIDGTENVTVRPDGSVSIN